jgi:hypothetical protein
MFRLFHLFHFTVEQNHEKSGHKKSGQLARPLLEKLNYT